MLKQSPSKSGRPARSSLLAVCRLSDGRLAWPVAQSSGLSEATFRARLKRGMSPDEAAACPVPPRDTDGIRRRRAVRREWVAAYHAHIAAEASARRKLSSRPARLDVLSDVYAGVICAADDVRLIVSPRAATFAVQRLERGQWVPDREFRSRDLLVAWLTSVALGVPSVIIDSAVLLPELPGDYGPLPALPRHK